MTLGHDRAAELFGSLASLFRASKSAAHRNTGEMGATGTPAAILKFLTHGDARPSDLATALHVAPSVVSRAIVPLEQDGLVGRTTDPCDARASLLTLTAAGRAKVDQLQEAYVETMRQILADWTDDEAHQAAGYFERLEQAIATLTVSNLPHDLRSALPQPATADTTPLSQHAEQKVSA